MATLNLFTSSKIPHEKLIELEKLTGLEFDSYRDAYFKYSHARCYYSDINKSDIERIEKIINEFNCDKILQIDYKL